MATIAWIGLGHMGRPMSNHMRNAGYTVSGVDIDPDARQQARAAGITIVDTIAEACAGADAVFTMLPAGQDVKKVLTGPDGVPVTKTSASLCLLQGSMTCKCSPHEACSFRSSVGRKSDNACVRYVGVIRFRYQRSKASREWLETGSRL
jgi:prephenate dehydrogenase